MKINKAIWENPPGTYRGIPMWSWNGSLHSELLKEQLSDFKKMGFGGAEIHSRIGLETEYLGAEFMERVKDSVNYAKENSLEVWLYDEDKWPSGFGAGRVTADCPEYAGKYLLFSKKYYKNGFHNRNKVFKTRITGNGELKFLRSYEIQLQDGKLADYNSGTKVRTGKNIWYSYLCTISKSPWFNNERYIDVLNSDAVEKFLEVAYEPYWNAVGDEFGKTIKAIFTDEPCFYRMENLRDAEQEEDIGIPYTNALNKLCLEKYGYELLEKIPEIIWELADGTVSKIRYYYHICLSELFTKSYAVKLAEWSRKHNICFTGHLLGENTLDEMSRSTGEIMYTMAQWDMPGCDMLADRHEYTTVKQVQSIVHQMGRKGVMCEIYGATNWNFDFRGHKGMGDWLAALGVTIRVPHLSWMTMKGQAKRDYPSPIDAHTTWYKKYPVIEDYYARLKIIMERGKPLVHIAVIHPIESYWMQMGPDSTTLSARCQLQEQYEELADWLLFNLLDFDYLSEALLSEYANVKEGKFNVGKMQYDTVIIPPVCTIRRNTLNLLQQFALNGGKVISLGKTPVYLEGCIADEAGEVFEKFIKPGFDKWSLLDLLQENREVDVWTSDGQRTKRLLYQLREEGTERYLFIAYGKKDTEMEYNLWSDTEEGETLIISIKGIWGVRKVDCENAEIQEIPVYIKKNCTQVQVKVYEHDSVLLLLSPSTCKREMKKQEEAKPVLSEYNWKEAVEYFLEEPNVVVLDQAEYSLDYSEWYPCEEILRIDNKIREELGYYLRSDSMPQPWIREKCFEKHNVRMRFAIDSNIKYEGVILALENEDVRIEWNGKEILKEDSEYFYVDHAIRCINLGSLKAGRNILQLSFLYGQDTDMEWCYLLGDFGVYFYENRVVIDKKPDKINFSDITQQGFPFYGGNITYQLPVEGHGNTMELKIPEYEAVLLHAQIDGKQGKDFYKSPYKVSFETMKGKQHLIEITAYGNRINTFGQLHDCNRREEYYSPKTWYTTGKNWSYTYQLHKSGILVPPVIKWR